MNRLIGVIHPWGSDPVGNAVAVMPILDTIMSRGEIPVFPPLMFPHLDDASPVGRAAGMEAGRYLFSRCRMVEVYGALTAGCIEDIAYCESAGIPMVRRDA